ncbi:hypothetical protein, partial [Campylobacter jejuni]|uniref:hypothetical protein n=1 Tax=Campylobacter jejuni TaxID=197 RepID=UPI001F089F26
FFFIFFICIVKFLIKIKKYFKLINFLFLICGFFFFFFFFIIFIKKRWGFVINKIKFKIKKNYIKKKKNKKKIIKI